MAATSYTWYGNGISPGGSGTWNTANSNWNGNTSWPTSGVMNVANFGTAGGNVTISGNVTANTLNFSSTGYSFLGSGNLTLSGNATVSPTINTGGYNVTFGMNANTLRVSGSTSINKTGVGTLTLVNGQNGSIPANIAWNVSGGTVDLSTGLYSSAIAIADGTALGTNTGNVLNLDRASLVFTASQGVGYNSSRTINVSGNGAAISDGGFAPGEGTSGGGTIAPTITIAAGNGLNLVSSNILDLDAPTITGAGGITVYGTGTAKILSTGNTYQGGTSINTGSTLVIGGATSLGAVSGNLSVGGTLNLNGQSIRVGQFTSRGGTGIAGNTRSAGDALGNTLMFQIGANAINTLTASSAVMSGNTGIALSGNSSSALTPGNYSLITSSGGGLTGGVVFAGGQNLTVPANQAIEKIGNTNYRLTLADTGSAVTLNVAAAPTHTVNVMPLGSSTTAGFSAQVPYEGGGYRAQLYQNLVNDGRFNPQFVGSSVTTGAQASNKPIGLDLLTTVGQTHHEGHGGYTSTDVLANLNANGGTGDNDGGFWLAPGNGVNPDYITLNIGSNDFAYSGGNAPSAINNLAQIVAQLAALRPNATIIVSSITYRGDGPPSDPSEIGEGAIGTTGQGIVHQYNPYIPGLVYQSVLAGEHVSFVDLYSLLTPGDSLANVGPDNIHLTQAGYDLMGNAWYSAMTTGQAFFTGNAGATWAGTSGNTTSWAQDYQRTTDSGVVPASGTDVYFNGAGGNTTLGADFSVRGVNFTGNATSPVTIGGGNTLTLGAGGITVQSGTAAHTISAAVILGSAQTWSNVSASQFTVSGNVSGNASNALTIGGNGQIVLAGRNSYLGSTTISGGTLTAGVASTVVSGAATSGAFGIRSAITLANVGGTTLNLNNFSQQIGSLAGGGSTGGNVTLGSAMLTAGEDGTSTSYGGAISGTGGLTKIGAGTLTLSGSSSYTGGTTISAGKLVASNVASLGNNTVKLAGGTLSLVGLGGTSLPFSSLQVNQSGNFTVAAVTNNILTLTDGGGSEARSAFTTSTQTIAGGFAASFVYTPGGNRNADGVAFVIQNSGNGSTALGGSGGFLGYGGNATTAIGKSGAVELNIYNTAGTAFGGNGTTGGYGSVLPVVLNSGHPILVNLAYNAIGNTLTEVLTDQSNGNTSTTTFTGVNYQNLLGATSGYVGFTGASGGSTAIQTISSFTFNQTGTSYANAISIAAASVSGIEVNPLGGSNNIQAGTLDVGAGATLNVTGGSNISGNSAYQLTLGATTLQGTATINVANNGAGVGTLSLGAVGSGAGNGTFTKTGVGTLVLTTAGTYGGGTTISAGTVRANNGGSGSATGTGDISVAASSSSGNYTGGRLGGNGTASGTVTLAGNAALRLGGRIAAGASDVSIGKLTTGVESWNGGGAYQWKINDSGTAASNPTITGTPGTSYDQLVIAGLTLNTSGWAAFTIAPSGNLTSVPVGAYNWAIAQVGAGNTTISINGNSTSASSSSNLLLAGGNFVLDTSGLNINGAAVDSNLFSLRFETVGGNNDLVLSYSVNPEPGTAMLVLTGGIPALMRRRRPRLGARREGVR